MLIKTPLLHQSFGPRGIAPALSLDLDKLHGQIRTITHFQLDFTAAGAASDFFKTLSNSISAKSILSTVLSYTAVIALILIIIVILPYIVKLFGRTLRISQLRSIWLF